MFQEEPVPEGSVLHSNIAKYCSALVGARCVAEVPDFPGPLPTALNRAALNVILSGNREYLVCAKDDGVRCFVIFMRIDGLPRLAVWLRQGAVSLIQCPPGNLMCRSLLFDGTVLDCERVEAGSVLFRAFDCYALAGERCTHRGLLFRLECAKAACAHAKCKFLELKAMRPLLHLQEFTRELEYSETPMDGLIFNPVPDAAMVEGKVNPLVFKFKNPHTLDLTVRRCLDPLERAWIPDAKIGLPFALYCGGQVKGTQVLLKRVGDPECVDYIGAVAEFEVLPGAQFRVLKARLDKVYPNGLQTVLDVLKTVEEKLELEELFGI